MVFGFEKTIDLDRMFKKILLVSHFESEWVRVRLIVSKKRLKTFCQIFELYHFWA